MSSKLDVIKFSKSWFPFLAFRTKLLWIKSVVLSTLWWCEFFSLQQIRPFTFPSEDECVECFQYPNIISRTRACYSYQRWQTWLTAHLVPTSHYATSLALTHSSLRISSECLPNSRIPQHRAGRSSLALRPRLALVASTVNLIRHYLEIFRFRSHKLHQDQTLGTNLAHSRPLESQ